jgi:hypothetical protein
MNLWAPSLDAYGASVELAQHRNRHGSMTFVHASFTAA